MIWKQELGIRNPEVDLGLRTMAKAYRSTFPTGLGVTKEKGADGLQSPSVNGLFLSKKDTQTKKQHLWESGGNFKIKKLNSQDSPGHS